MLTSSPTISEPASPSQAFHTSAHRSYHASRRPSASSSAHSPRFAVNSAAARRFDAPLTPKLPPPTSPHTRSREYVDTGTQYTPPGLPPTYRSPSQPGATVDTTNKETTPLTAPAAAQIQRGDSSATEVITEPLEPQLRVDPEPITRPQNGHPRTSPTTLSRTDGEKKLPIEQGAAQQDGKSGQSVPASPAKRARAQEPDLKTMPLLYETCDVKDLGVLISDMLMELVRLNDGYPLRDGTLTRFHSRYATSIAIYMRSAC